MRRPIRVGLALFAAAACSSGVDPGDEPLGRMVFTVRRPVVPTTPAIDSVALLLEPLDDGAAGVTVGAPFPASQDSVLLLVEIPMTRDVASLSFTVRLLAGGGIVFETRSRGSVRRGAETEVPPVEPAIWRPVAASGPGPRQAAGLVHAPALGGLVMFGGLTQTGNDGSTWIFDGTDWTAPQIPGSPPPGRHGHAMAFDDASSEIVMFGGRVTNIAPVDETWVLNSAGWVRAQPAASPGPRTAHAMAYDRRADEVVLFGGLNLTGPLNDTWVWDGGTWHEARQNAGPPPLSGHTMVWSSLRQRVVLFGGGAGDEVRSDVWEWDGARWQPRELLLAVPERREHAAGWDTSRNRMVVLGGVEIAGVPLEDEWELVDDRWMLVNHSVRPGPRFGAAMTDAGADGVFLFGGRDREGFLGDLWRYR